MIQVKKSIGDGHDKALRPDSCYSLKQENISSQLANIGRARDPGPFQPVEATAAALQTVELEMADVRASPARESPESASRSRSAEGDDMTGGGDTHLTSTSYMDELTYTTPKSKRRWLDGTGNALQNSVSEDDHAAMDERMSQNLQSIAARSLNLTPQPIARRRLLLLDSSGDDDGDEDDEDEIPLPPTPTFLGLERPLRPPRGLKHFSSPTKRLIKRRKLEQSSPLKSRAYQKAASEPEALPTTTSENTDEVQSEKLQLVENPLAELSVTHDIAESGPETARKVDSLFQPLAASSSSDKDLPNSLPNATGIQIFSEPYEIARLLPSFHVTTGLTVTCRSAPDPFKPASTVINRESLFNLPYSIHLSFCSPDSLLEVSLSITKDARSKEVLSVALRHVSPSGNNDLEEWIISSLNTKNLEMIGQGIENYWKATCERAKYLEWCAYQFPTYLSPTALSYAATKGEQADLLQPHSSRSAKDKSQGALAQIFHQSGLLFQDHGTSVSSAHPNLVINWRIHLSDSGEAILDYSASAHFPAVAEGTGITEESGSLARVAELFRMLIEEDDLRTATETLVRLILGDPRGVTA
ncbi:hypothetical protein MMC25_000415 [Agyrium rufum]|nr:hypothetical protein [Agyrium rufum]